LVRVRVDGIVLVVLVALVLGLAPGHGALGWVLAVVGVLLAAVVVGLLGRRYPWIHGAPRR
jgi:hypothetical protein